MTDQKSCPNCGYVEQHVPITDEIAERESRMTVMCSDCGETFAKPSPPTGIDTDSES